jgi:purine-nucleoside/S-methyl-5'-thioadenosine phosphorylase / adenosine deaminase
MIQPDWGAPPRVRALVTTRGEGDLSQENHRNRLRAHLPAEPRWLRQAHGTTVVCHPEGGSEADAAITRTSNTVCAVMVADCMPVLLADEAGSVVGAAHAGWRGLCAGVLEATVAAMAVPGKELLAWLGPAIGPRVYEVGDEVRAAFLAKDAAARSAFAPTRPGHWLLDLYAVARQRLKARGVTRIHGGRYCTYSDPETFFSYRREGNAERMAALIWLT